MYPGGFCNDDHAITRKLLESTRAKGGTATGRATRELAPIQYSGALNSPAYVAPTPASAVVTSTSTFARKGPASVRSSVAPITGTLTKEEREERLEIWKEHALNKNSDTTVEETNQAYLDAVNLYCEKEQANYDFSTTMIERALAAYVPFYSTGIHDGKLRVEFSGTSKDEQYWSPSQPLLAFGSLTKPYQGFKTIPRKNKVGNLKNVYVIRAQMEALTSNAPFSIGVLLGEIVVRQGKREFESWGGTKYYYNHAPYEFHYVVPPHAQNLPTAMMYRSTAEVNNQYGFDYTYLTHDEAVISKDCKQVGNTHMNIPVNGPLFKWIMTESSIVDIGQKSEDDPGMWRVKRAVFEDAVDSIQHSVKTMLPVRNLENFVIKFVPLTGTPVSISMMARSQILRAVEYKEAHGVTLKEGTPDPAKQRETYNMWFDIPFEIMFRDMDEVEKKEEDQLDEAQ